MERNTRHVPVTVNGNKVIAAMRRVTGEGEAADVYTVICDDGSGTFIVRTAYADENQPESQHDYLWVAANGHYMLTWERACKVFAERAGLLSS